MMQFRHLRFLSLVCSLALTLIGPGFDLTPTSKAGQATSLSYGLVIDTSGSLRAQLTNVVETGKLIVRGNKKGDETFLLRFVDRKSIQITTDFTESIPAIEDGLDNLFPQGGQTAIIDAVYSAAQHLAEHTKASNAERRRVLILITDGEDRESRRTSDELINLLRQEKIQVYIVGLVGDLRKASGEKTYQKALDFLNSLANRTGGAVFYPKSRVDLSNAANEIVRAVHG